LSKRPHIAIPGQIGRGAARVREVSTIPHNERGC